MKKIGLTLLCSVLLSACGGSSSSDVAVEEIIKPVSEDVYSFDRFTGLHDIVLANLYINSKTYHFDPNQLTIEYDRMPIFKTEALRTIITPDYQTFAYADHLDAYRYSVGKNVSFNQNTLQYHLDNADGSKPLALSWHYKKNDVSGVPVLNDQNNPYHEISKSDTFKILAAVLGVGFNEKDVFPEGSVCWQAQSAESSQEYIEYYPKDIVRHVEEDREILDSGTWGKAQWTVYRLNADEKKLANVKVVISDQVYWGFYRTLNENLMSEQNELACDLMNKVAYDFINTKLSSLKEFYDSPQMKISYKVWMDQYLPPEERNPKQSANIVDTPPQS